VPIVIVAGSVILYLIINALSVTSCGVVSSISPVSFRSIKLQTSLVSIWVLIALIQTS
jgi:hypothetical protein